MAWQLHRGKVARTPRVVEIRPLTRDDLACLREARAPQGRVKAFRDRHHRLARYFAAGLTTRRISEITNLGIGRLIQYTTDPAFQNLIAEYRGKVIEDHAEQIDEFAALELDSALCAARLKNERLHRAEDVAEDGGELPALRELLPVTMDFGDRFGYGKHLSQTNVNLDFAKELEAMRRRSGGSNVIEAKPVGDSASLSPAQPGAEACFKRRV